MSLHRRIMASIVLVVVLTVLAGVGVGYYATQSRLGVFVDRIGGEEAVRMARLVSSEYTAAGGWGRVDSALSEAGYLYERTPPGERSERIEAEHAESFHQDQVRVVVVDIDGRVVKDNLSELPSGTVANGLQGHRETVFDATANRPVGHIYVDVNQEFLSTESHGFLDTLLSITAVGGVLTAGVAMLLAAWLSKRITRPVTALTEATQAIARGDTARLPVTSADELGRMSKAFNRMTSTLQNQRELRRRLINDLSHELNTPLSVIQLEARGLRDGLQTAEKASDHIIQEVDRLRGLVTDLDWLAETDHGELRLTLEPTQVEDLLTTEADRWQPLCLARQVDLSLQIPPDLPDVQIDRMRMSQALGNVISNAIRCTEPGGHITILASPDSDETLAISVTDDGIGIPAADLPHVFDRFYRTERSRNYGRGGTGLGLAITRATVETHGGTVTAASDGPGQGATVTIHLPPSDQTPASTEGAPNGPRA